MTASGLEVAIRRGLLLRKLEANYPHPLMRRLLELPDGVYADDGDMRRDLAYLKEVRLIEESSETVAQVKVRLYRCTAAGVDVVQGHARCAGVDVG